MARVLIFDGAPARSQQVIASHGGPTHTEMFERALSLHETGLEYFSLNVAEGERLPQGVGLTDFRLSRSVAAVQHARGRAHHGVADAGTSRSGMARGVAPSQERPGPLRRQDPPGHALPSAGLRTWRTIPQSRRRQHRPGHPRVARGAPRRRGDVGQRAELHPSLL